MNRLGVLAGKEEGNFSAGLYTDEGTVPLQGISIHVEVLDMASKTTIRQRFKNTWGQSIEATYCFPMVPDAAVNGFRAIVGGNKIEGIVKQREEAFDTYDAAMEEGHGAFLMDQEEEDIFTVSVGNLKPDEEAEIEISYVATLKVQDKKVRLTIPTTISPRYIPPGSDPIKADRISPPVWSEVPYGLSIEVRIRQVSDLVKYLLSKGITGKCERVPKAMMFASKNKHFEIVRLLAENGFNVRDSFEEHGTA